MPARQEPSHDLPPLFLPSSGTHIGMPRGTLPLQGLTILTVEDSRFACDALRLLCQRSGARLRRAETIAAARAHLKVYRPDVVIIDLGLPDGRGDSLIRELALQSPRLSLVLGTSGDPDGRAAVLAAGAAGFLEKPLESLAAFQTALLRHLPDRAAMHAGPFPSDTPVSPDPMALRDDLARAADLIAADPNPSPNLARYLAGFVSGLALVAHDTALGLAARECDEPLGLERLAGLLSSKLTKGSAPLIAPPSTPAR
ncbi:MAG: response regulator [Paracoccaceae bacterium]